MSQVNVLSAATLMTQKSIRTMATTLGVSAPISVRCACERAPGLLKVPNDGNHHFTNWPQNFAITVDRYYQPLKRTDVVAAIVDAEKSGFHVRAIGGGYSFSDVISPVSGVAAPPKSGTALVDTTALKNDLSGDLPRILAPSSALDPKFLIHVEAGITLQDLIVLLDGRPTRQTLAAIGGAPLTTLAGCISTGTHGGDSTVPPLSDQILAVHLIGAGGIEYWIEQRQIDTFNANAHVTDPAGLLKEYPCLSPGNIIYDDDAIGSVLCSMGSMGIIYSAIVKTVPQFGLVQHRQQTNWNPAETGIVADLINGNYLESLAAAAPPILGAPGILGPFQPNNFSQLVINPYTGPRANGGVKSSVWATNRVPIPIPATPHNPPSPKPDLDGAGHAVRDALGFNVLDIDVRFINFLAKHKNDTPAQAADAPADFVNFLMANDFGRAMYALVDFIVSGILPTGDRTDVGFRLTDVVGFGLEKIKSLSVEAAFDMDHVLPFVNKVLVMVDVLLAKKVLIGGYLSMRVVGAPTSALLGMARFSPTCFVEYAMLSGTAGVDQFARDLQRLALDNGGILHWGQCNDVMTAADLEKAYTKQVVDRFRQVRRRFTKNGTLKTFDNIFTERFNL
jgi:FAD binding domain